MKRAIVNIGVLVLIIGVFQIASVFIYIPRTTTVAMPIHQSQILVMENFVVQPSTIKSSSYFLNGGDNVSILVSVGYNTTEVIDFSVNDNSKTYLSYPRTSGVHNFGGLFRLAHYSISSTITALVSMPLKTLDFN